MQDLDFRRPRGALPRFDRRWEAGSSPAVAGANVTRAPLFQRNGRRRRGTEQLQPEPNMRLSQSRTRVLRVPVAAETVQGRGEQQRGHAPDHRLLVCHAPTAPGSLRLLPLTLQIVLNGMGLFFRGTRRRRTAWWNASGNWPTTTNL